MMTGRSRTLAALGALGFSLLSPPAWATSLPGDGAAPHAPASPKSETVKKYLDDCRGKSTATTSCDKLKKDAVEILKEDLRTLGSSGNRSYIPTILTIFRSDEPELRIAAADAIGMIGPQAPDFEALALAANDPVPDVRRAVAQMLSQGKGGLFSALSQRVSMTPGEGRMPDSVPDPGTLGMPVVPGSTYLFYASDVGQGRVSYVTSQSPNDAAAFYKSKAKKGPLTLEEFQHTYHDQLEDDQKAREAASDEIAKQMETVKPDPANMDAYQHMLRRMLAANTGKMMVMLTDMYPPEHFGTPTVYVLEERHIGNKPYPTKYVVLYQDHAFKRPGFRLSWMTASDQTIKSLQRPATAKPKREETRREKEPPPMVKEKSTQEKKQFKKGQSDLEKELGF